jgi:hypothetical protein
MEIQLQGGYTCGGNKVRKGPLGAGIALIILALIMTPIIYYFGMDSMSSLDPETNNEKVIPASGTVTTLKKGDYDIWSEKDPGDLSISDPNGNEVEIEDSSSLFPIEGKDKRGIFTADQTGIYTFTYGVNSTLYLTKPINTGFYDIWVMGGLILGIIILIGGIALLVVGIIMKPRKIIRYHPPRSTPRRRRPERLESSMGSRGREPPKRE